MTSSGTLRRACRRDMVLFERRGHPCVQVEGPDENAAITAVQQRAKQIMVKLGQGDTR